MKKRKLIGLITVMPESIHVKRVLDGVFKQCEKYGYDVAVFAPLSHLLTMYTAYRDGEWNIFELMNFDLLDAVIVDCISLVEDNIPHFKDLIQHKLERECTKPVVAIGMSLGNYPMVESDDGPVFRSITEHILDVHKRSDIYFMSGPEENEVSAVRAEAFREVMQERGLSVEGRIISGDFWYSSGAALADRLVAGELAMPEAVICANDYMAIGLANRLLENDIRIPEDIIITGFDASQEAALNAVSITSFDSRTAKAAADAVDMVRKAIDAEAEILPYDDAGSNYLHAGMSCGCAPDFIHSARTFKDTFYYLHYDYDQKDRLDNIDIGMLMEGNVVEDISAAESHYECMTKICSKAFLTRPYLYYYLCLKEDWLDLDSVTINGYPEKMKTVVITNTIGEMDYAELDNPIVFETKRMLPQMFEEHDEPRVYYFSAVHVQEVTLGYSVQCRTLKEPQKQGVVYRNWLRSVSSALETVRAKNRLRMLSIYDEMTGAYNRRGMKMMLENLCKEAKEGDRFFAAVIDMDELKYVNDNFGHSEGDFGIKLICKTAMSVSRVDEICVRAGGDEFYILGVGQYEEGEPELRMERFTKAMEAAAAESGKPYPIMGSIGCAMAPVDDKLEVESVINAADAAMYRNKVERKKQRK